MKRKYFILFILFFNYFICGQNATINNNYFHACDISLIELETFFYPQRILSGNIELTKYLLLSESLAALTQDELRILRNIYYAKYGKIFQSNDLRDYFTNFFNWYNPKYENVDSFLTKTEKQTVKDILLYENGYPLSVTNENELKGSWLSYRVDNGGRGNTFDFKEDNTVDFTLLDFPAFSSYKGFSGTFFLRKGFLFIEIEKIKYIEHPYIFENYSKNNKFEWKNEKEEYLTLSKKKILRFPVSNIQNENGLYIRIGNETFYK
ncbi:YARHG domain-containing protein [Treponema parvum]|uniref:YARHG domain-containing protein n=1 Tax=Treponema parvum TaxID=138851 RepID=UPI001AEBBD83|nr:YARHG domain-containing protein [Treponema parvum]QTQ17195.1 YARHG domain-containing protein [Treponema parvum]